jgi:tetratricopeptide (TPR) repeat protein
VIAFGAAAIVSLRKRLYGINRDIINLGVTTLVTVFMVLSWQQSEMYGDPITLYQTALKKNPDLWMLHSNLGDALFDAGRIQEAIPELKEAIQMNPDTEDAHFYLARSLAKNRRWDEAIQHYEETIRLRPDFMQANRELADLYAGIGRTQEAMVTAEKALVVAHVTGNIKLQKQIEDWIATHKSGQLTSNFAGKSYSTRHTTSVSEAASTTVWLACPKCGWRREFSSAAVPAGPRCLQCGTAIILSPPRKVNQRYSAAD